MSRGGRRGLTMEERTAKYVRVLPHGCHEWTGARIPDGYGHTSVNGRAVLAHRLYYEAAKGHIADGLEIDHLCRNRSCVNPDHLEPVSHRENVLRGENPMAQQARRTHCKRGHLFDEENTYLMHGRKRVCKECRKLWDARRCAKDKELGRRRFACA
jgi:hypothetical protein